MNHCNHCGHALTRGIPPGDDRERDICPSCGRVHYQNPRMVVGCIPLWQGRVLLCKRAIEPRYGTWTLPAGFLEIGESVEQGARRELMEEALASAAELQPYGLYDIRHVGQVYVMFIAQLANGEFGAGQETLEAAFYEEAAVPWDELSFPVVEMALRRYYRDLRRGSAFPFHIDDVVQRMKPADESPR